MIKVRDFPPLYLLDDFNFPSPYEEFDDGFVGASYDLHPKRLLEGYSRGFFPWYQDDEGLFHWFVLNRRLSEKVGKQNDIFDKAGAILLLSFVEEIQQGLRISLLPFVEKIEPE
jgi:hypothetical protein